MRKAGETVRLERNHEVVIFSRDFNICTFPCASASQSLPLNRLCRGRNERILLFLPSDVVLFVFGGIAAEEESQMLISESTETSMNSLIKYLFYGNAVVDNMYYNLNNKGFGNLAESIHDPVAHRFGVWADMFSDIMDKLGARPTRIGLPDAFEDLQVSQIYTDLQQYFLKLRAEVISVKDSADLSGDCEIVKFLDDFLEETLLPYIRQAKEWKDALDVLGDKDFNIHVKEYTHYIPKA